MKQVDKQFYTDDDRQKTTMTGTWTSQEYISQLETQYPKNNRQ